MLDGNFDNKIGSAIVVPPHIPILHKGVKGDGTFSWVQISMFIDPFNIASIYAPHDYSRRVELWN